MSRPRARASNLGPARAAGTGRLVAAAVSLFLVAGCEPPPVTPVAVRLGAYAGETSALVYVAKAQGLFVAHGVDVDIRGYEAGKLAADALLAGQVDIATSTDNVFVSNAFEHPDLRVLGAVAVVRNLSIVARRDRGIERPGDLRGKRVGVTRKSNGEFYLGTFLAFNDLGLADIEVVDLHPSALVREIADGRIDAAATWEPNVYEIKERLGARAVQWPGQEDQPFYFLLLTRAGWLEENPVAVERLMGALIEAERFTRSHPREAQALIAERFAHDAEYIRYAWAKHDFSVSLPQALLVAMEDQARWRIENGLSAGSELPNYLGFLYGKGLESVRAESVSVIR